MKLSTAASKYSVVWVKDFGIPFVFGPPFFYAVVNIIHLMIQNGVPLFTVDY